MTWTVLDDIRSIREQYGEHITDSVIVEIPYFEVLIEAAEAVVKFSDLEPGYKGGAITEAAKKLMEEV